MLDIIYNSGILRTRNIDLMDLEIGTAQRKTNAYYNYGKQSSHK
jgi:hypothetical protein